MKMKGTVKAYSTAVNAGYIRGDDGINYQFGKAEWKGAAHPDSNNAAVNFVVIGERATGITDRFSEMMTVLKSDAWGRTFLQTA